jgi:PhoH-like ATPase
MPLPKAPNKPATLLSNSDVGNAANNGRHEAPTLQHSQARAPATEAIKPVSYQASEISRPLTSTGPKKLAPAPANKKRSSSDLKKLFVLDTNVLMHDPASLFRFAEHDVFLPMVTLEELDHNKKGMSEVSRNARQASRWLDGIAAQADSPNASPIEQGLPLNALGNTEASGRLFFQTKPLSAPVDLDLPMGKADNQIIAVVSALQKQFTQHQVVLVSKDINMRIKARALALPTEDYHNDQVIDDAQLLYTGSLALPEDFWEKHAKGIESWQQQASTFYKFSGPLVASLQINQLVHLEGALPLQAQVKEITGKQAVLQTLRDYTHLKNSVWGITARNREQNFALNLLMNPDIDFVTLLGQAGTGKTLLALAAALVQTIEARRFTEIIVTRATVPVGEDIGYLPGTEEEKMQPWMGALEDNLEVLMQGQGGAAAGGEWGRAATQDLIKARIRVKAMSFMRGRTFINKFLIIDEAQNLTPKQMKTLVTRAGPGTKVVCMGNIAQIDTPYLTESSSGLTFVVDRFRGWAHSGHIVLQRGERSRLADYAAEAL